MKKNLYILTEESISITEIKKIVDEASKECSLDISLTEQVRVIPKILNNVFKHEYELTGFQSIKINKVLIFGVDSFKDGSDRNPFVDYLVYLQEHKPDPKDLFKNCIFAIEATKTNTYDSRNTAMGQRAGKFVHLNYFLEDKKSTTKLIMYKTHPQAAKDHRSVEFVSRCLSDLPVKVDFWEDPPKKYQPFLNINDMITEKNAISATNKRTNDVPLKITTHGSGPNIKYELHGRLAKPGLGGNAASSWTGSPGHDPNKGALALHAKKIRDSGFKGKIDVINHDLDPAKAHKWGCKLIKFATYLDFSLQGCQIIPKDFLPIYYEYLTSGKEKIASILAQVMLINRGMKTIFEHHGGCEKSFIDTDCINQKKPHQDRYIVLPKKYSTNGRKIPDLIMCDDMNKTIYLYEGKKASKKDKGLADIKKYQDLEQDILSEHYPDFSFERRLTIEGGQKDNDPIVSFQLDENSVVHKKREFI